MSDGGWWDRRLGGGASVPSHPTSYPQAPQAPVQAPQRQPIQNPYRNFGEEPEVSGGPSIGIGEAVAMGDNYRPKAGKAKALREGHCPECGSNNYFSRANGILRGPPPAPLCEDCGHNGGLFEQTGYALNAIGAGQGTPVKSARQDQASVHGAFGVPIDNHWNPVYGAQGQYIRG